MGLNKNVAAYYEKETHFDQLRAGYDRGSNPLAHQQNAMVYNSYIQSQKGYALKTYLPYRKFTGALQQSADNVIKGLEICALQ